MKYRELLQTLLELPEHHLNYEATVFDPSGQVYLVDSIKPLKECFLAGENDDHEHPLLVLEDY